MLFQLLRGGFDPLYFVGYLLGLTLGVTLHEFAHNYGAYAMGDPYPKRAGRLTLNPLVHIYWPGWLMWAIIGFGPLGYAPIDPYRLPRENRRYRWLVAVAAGPIANLLLAMAAGLIYRLFGGVLSADLGLFFSALVSINVLLFLFNLLPLYPIDGWQIVYSLLPPDLARQWYEHQQTTMYILYAIIFIDLATPISIIGSIIFAPAVQITRLLMGF